MLLFKKKKDFVNTTVKNCANFNKHGAVDSHSVIYDIKSLSKGSVGKHVREQCSRLPLAN